MKYSITDSKESKRSYEVRIVSPLKKSFIAKSLEVTRSWTLLPSKPMRTLPNVKIASRLRLKLVETIYF